MSRLPSRRGGAFPDDPGRRLSATPPSRFQHYRARRGFLSGGVLEALRALYESAAVDTALRMGMFDSSAGSFSRPDKRQFMAGDLTWVSARYKRHRCDAFDPRTGKTRRHDPDADYYHHSDGKRSGSPGRGLVFLTGRNPHPHERIIFGHGFMPLRGDPAILGRNDGDVGVDMFLGVLGRHDALDERVHGFVYDGAADSEAVDRLLDAGKHAVVPIRKTSTGNYAAINLGAYDFKTKDGTISRHTAIAIAGTVVVVLPDGDGDDFYVPLDCPQVKPVKRKKSYTIYGVFAMPDLDIVPPRLVGARTLIRLNSTPEERTAIPHRRRARAVRTIPAADPRCPEVRGLRPDVESLNSRIKNLLPYKSARLRTSQHDDSNLNILTDCMLQLTAAKAAYDQRTAPNSGQPPPPRPPRSIRAPAPAASSACQQAASQSPKPPNPPEPTAPGQPGAPRHASIATRQATTRPNKRPQRLRLPSTSPNAGQRLNPAHNPAHTPPS